MKINSVCLLPGEQVFLYAAIADFSYGGARNKYANWLEEHGDFERARTVQSTIAAYQNLDKLELQNLAGPASWQRMIAVPLLLNFIDNTIDIERAKLQKFRDLIFTHLRPALSLEYAIANQELEVGSSYLWGQPDIPKGEGWPKISEASNWYDAREDLPQDQHCAFVGQFAFKDFAQSVLGQELPSDGGFSIFAITEVNKLGIVETLVRPWDPQAPLSRRDAPEDIIEDKLGDTTNMPKPVHVIILTETLSLPDATDEPFSEDIPDCKYGEIYGDIYDSLLCVCDGNTIGFGGYLRGTSGGDPSPNTDALRLAVLRTNPDCGLIHFAIPAADLKIGRLNKVEYVWCDWDS